jgi:hypothetical protein
MVFRWRPRHTTNAIELMALNITFEEPLTHRVIERIAAAVEERVKAVGPYQVMPVAGARLVNNSIVPFAMGAAVNLQPAPGQVTATGYLEQVEVNPMAISYRSAVYSKWENHFSRLKDWMTGPVESALDVGGLQSIRLEYQDRFALTGAFDGTALAELLRRDSNLIAPHVFDAEGLWHSHTGRFRNREQTALEQIHIGSIDEAVAPDTEVHRWVNIMIARENRQSQSAPLPSTVTELLESVDLMHAEIKSVLPLVLTRDALASMGIPQDE